MVSCMSDSSQNRYILNKFLNFINRDNYRYVKFYTLHRWSFLGVKTIHSIHVASASSTSDALLTVEYLSAAY